MSKQSGETNNRSERPGNATPIQPYDNTSHAYKAEPRKGSSQTRFGIALSLAMVVALVVFFSFLYEVITSGYERFK